MQLHPGLEPDRAAPAGAPIGAPVALPRRRLALPDWATLLFSNRLAALGCALLTAIVLAALCAPLLASADSTTIGTVAPSQPPSWSYPFGTNHAGESILAQVLWGARFTLAVSAVTGVAVTALACLVGMTAGYLDGWVDDALGTLMNVFLVIPQLPLLIVVAAYAPVRGSSTLADAATMIAVIAFTGWAWGGRVLRSQTLSLKNRDFVLAAQVAGESTWRIIFREILPNMVSLMANTFIMSSLGAIFVESGLEFLGLGDVNNVTWGTMLYQAQSGSALLVGEWWDFVFPGLAIACTALALILINNGIDVISNPRLRTIRVPRGRRGRPGMRPAIPGEARR